MIAWRPGQNRPKLRQPATNSEAILEFPLRDSLKIGSLGLLDFAMVMSRLPLRQNSGWPQALRAFLLAAAVFIVAIPPSAHAQEEPCDDAVATPFPAPGSSAAGGFWQELSRPLPPAAVWNPPGAKRVGLQAGHWLVEEAPGELRPLGPGSSGGGKSEWEVNLEIAEKTAALLRDAGVEVDVLPTTLPERYRAHAFIALHADGDVTGRLSGFKITRPVFSAIPETDDRLVERLNDAYQPVTGLARDDEHISRRMLGYYAFNSRRYCHAIAPGVPAAIVEMGFLTNASDRMLLINRQDLAARGLADGILAFLGQR